MGLANGSAEPAARDSRQSKRDANSNGFEISADDHQSEIYYKSAIYSDTANPWLETEDVYSRKVLEDYFRQPINASGQMVDRNVDSSIPSKRRRSRQNSGGSLKNVLMYWYREYSTPFLIFVLITVIINSIFRHLL